MRCMVTGADGMLGTDVVAKLRRAGHEVDEYVLHTLDLADADAVERAARGCDVIWNCAAWTDVDGAETHEVEAFEVNATIPGVLAAAAADVGARLVHLSTDYVFSGDATEPYAEDAPTGPRSAYGRSKEAGERIVRRALPQGHLIVRTAWLYGAYGECFPRTIARLAAERGAVAVVDDQIGQPTWTRDVVEVILGLLEADAPAGTYHATASGQTSWFGFARRVVEAAGIDPVVVTPTASGSFPRPAPRPAYSVLGHDALERLGVAPIGDWADRWAVSSAEVLGLS